MYDYFIREFPSINSVLDIGVTSSSTVSEANFFEAFFPDKSKITAVGIEDATFLETKYPGLKFVKVLPNQNLPFPDNHFDVSFSNAVIEHIVSQDERKKFIAESVRVAKAAFLTTPNKYFLVEPHTGVPLLHFLFPRLFYYFLDKGFFAKFYNSQNLKLLSRSDLCKDLSELNLNFKIAHIRSLGIKSNLIIIIKKA